MSKRYTVEFNAKITPVKPLNDEFTLCKCYVMALDKNRNMSYIGKDAAEAALPTLYNIPVIGHMQVDNEGNYHMGGHDMTLTVDGDGNLMFKSLCVPYGVVPQQDNVYYEDIQEPNGDTKTYLVCDVILWTGRFPELNEAIYDAQTYFGQSMEINVNNYSPLEEDKNYTNILGYTYSALCLLGKSDNADEHVEPCFPMSRVESYDFSLDNDKFSELMTQLKNELALCFETNAGKGGENMNETNTITEQIEGGAQPDQGASFSAEAPVVTVEDNPTVFASTYKEKREAISEVMPCVAEKNESGDLVHCIDFWLCDFDETFAYVERSEWSDKEGYSETKGRFTYSFSEDGKKANITSDFEEMFVKWLTQDEVAQLDAMRAHYEELVEYKNSRETADRNAEYDSAVSEFEDLIGNEEFDNVCNNKYSYATVEELKNTCYIIRGKFSIPAPKPKAHTEPVIPVGQPAHKEQTIRERFHAKYGSR